MICPLSIGQGEYQNEVPFIVVMNKTLITEYSVHYDTHNKKRNFRNAEVPFYYNQKDEGGRRTSLDYFELIISNSIVPFS